MNNQLKKILSTTLSMFLSFGMIQIPVSAEGETAPEEANTLEQVVTEEQEEESVSEEITEEAEETQEVVSEETTELQEGSEEEGTDENELLTEKSDENNVLLEDEETEITESLNEIPEEVLEEETEEENLNFDDEVDDSGMCGDNLTWVMTKSHVLTISGSGPMYDYTSGSTSSNPSPFRKYIKFYGGEVQKIIIEDGVTHIGNYSFTDLKHSTWNQDMIVIPDSVESIGKLAFAFSLPVNNIPSQLKSVGEQAFRANNITKAVLPETLTTLSNSLFCQCRNLEEVQILGDVTVIPNSAFSECNILKKVGLPLGLTGIGQYAFSDCGMEEITLPINLQTIGEHAFDNCDNLKEIIIPKNVTSIYDAFGYCDKLEKVVYQNGTTLIAGGAFYKCYELKTVVIPSSVTEIEQACSAVQAEDVYYYGTEKEWEKISFTDNGRWWLRNATIHYGGVPKEFGDLLYVILGDGESQHIRIVGVSNTSASDIQIPETIEDYPVSEIGSDAFENNTAIVSVTFPENLKNIYNDALKGCSGLTSVEFGSNIDCIEQNAFSGCYHLNTIEFSGSIDDWDSMSIQEGNEILSKVLVDKFSYGGLNKHEVWSFPNPGFYNYKSDYVSQLEKRLDILGKVYLSNQFNEVLYADSCSHCYGMAATVILNKYDHRFTVGNLSDCALNADSREFIMNHYMAQFQPEYQFQFKITSNLVNVLRTLDHAAEEANNGALPFLVSYPSHTVVCYGKEEGHYSYQGKTYSTRALIYDSNYPGLYSPEFCIYYNLNKNEYIVPAYEGVTTFIPYFGENGEYTTLNQMATDIIVISNDLGLMDPVKYGDLTYTERYLKSYIVMGKIINDTTPQVISSLINQGIETVSYFFDSSSNDSEHNMIHFVLPEDCEGVTIPKELLNSDYAFYLVDENNFEYVTAESDSDIRITFDGKMSFSGKNTTYTAILGNCTKLGEHISSYLIAGETNGVLKAFYNDGKLDIYGDDLVGTNVSSIDENVTDKYEINENINVLSIIGDNNEMAVDTSVSTGDILPMDIPTDGIIPNGIWTAGIKDKQYAGSAIKQNFRVYDGTRLLKEKTDYTVTYKNNTNAYTYEGDRASFIPVKGDKTPYILITGKGNYSGKTYVPFSIDKVDLNDPDQVYIEESITLKANGKVQRPVPVITFNGKTVSSKEYTLYYYDRYGMELTKKNGPKEAGTYTIVVVANRKNFVGEKEIQIPLTIAEETNKQKAVALSKAITVTVGNAEYDGVLKETARITSKTGYELEEGRDYEVSYSANVKAGTATVTATGKGIYTGTVKKTFKITPRLYAEHTEEFTFDVSDAVYSKGGAIPEVHVFWNGNELKAGTDYTLKYTNNKQTVTDGKVQITFKGNFKGSADTSFKIAKKDIASVNITAKDLVYKKGKYKSTPVLTDIDGKKLKAGTDYDKAYEYTYSNGDPIEGDVPAGSEVTVTVYAKGSNYTEHTSYTYKILESKNNLSSATVQFKDSEGKTVKSLTKNYTGEEVTLSKEELIVTMKAKENGKTVTVPVGPENYEIVSYTNNVNKGTAKATLKGIGEYGGTKTVSFKIGQRSIVDYWQGVKNFFSKLF
ncbi:MAG: leucine-rich repeat domain-containing protein [Solobacterium sp.]|nr:leucine-rich repeat domain-containing protein [Solobacterium sp.]